ALEAEEPPVAAALEPAAGPRVHAEEVLERGLQEGSEPPAARIGPRGEFGLDHPGEEALGQVEGLLVLAGPLRADVDVHRLPVPGRELLPRGAPLLRVGLAGVEDLRPEGAGEEVPRPVRVHTSYYASTHDP